MQEHCLPQGMQLIAFPQLVTSQFYSRLFVHAYTGTKLMSTLLQDADKQCLYVNLPLVKANGTSTSPNAIGGNMHNEHLQRVDKVSLYKAVEVYHQKMSHIGDYVAYIGENEAPQKVTLLLIIYGLILF